MTSNLSKNETGAYVGGVASFVPTHFNEISQRNRHLSPASTNYARVFLVLLCGLNAINNCFGYEV